MKAFLLILFCFVVTGLQAQKKALLAGTDYAVVSKTPDRTIAPGYCMISGNVKMFSSGNPLEHVRIGTGSVETESDSSGHFKLTFPISDTLFYIYRSGWSEIYETSPEFIDQHHIIIEAYLNQEMQLMKKPVIYLYSDESLKAELQLKPKGNFIFTYPEYKDGWEIGVNPDGTLTDLKTEKSYPYLFWEAETQGLNFRFREKNLTGWMIRTDTAVQFLERQLAQLGLSSREQTDFITFWGPTLVQKEYALIQFLVDDQVDREIAHLTISPKPDAIRRVYLYAAPLEKPYHGINCVTPIFEPFERKGFTVIEWGGTILDINQLNF